MQEIFHLIRKISTQVPQVEIFIFIYFFYKYTDLLLTYAAIFQHTRRFYFDLFFLFPNPISYLLF